MTKQTKLLVGFTTVLGTAMMVGYLMPINRESNTQNQSSYTITTDDGYHAETTYFLTKDAYQDYVDNIDYSATLSEGTGNSTYAKKNAVEDDGEFVIGAVQNVCVYEQTDEDGNVSESHLMTSEEIETFETSVSTASDDVKIEIDKDTESMYYLDISLYLVYSSGDNSFYVTGMAGWEDKLVWAWDSNKAAEEDYFDYISLTWGGERMLKADYKNIYGTYYNGNAVSFSRKNSDSYAGYVWQFNEKSGYLGKEMKSSVARVNLKNVGTNEYRETNAKMTYIHTWGAIGGDVSFSVDSEGTFAAGVELSETEKQWQIEIDVSGLQY